MFFSFCYTVTSLAFNAASGVTENMYFWGTWAAMFLCSSCTIFSWNYLYFRRFDPVFVKHYQCFSWKHAFAWLLVARQLRDRQEYKQKFIDFVHRNIVTKFTPTHQCNIKFYFSKLYTIFEKWRQPSPGGVVSLHWLVCIREEVRVCVLIPWLYNYTEFTLIL